MAGGGVRQRDRVPGADAADPARAADDRGRASFPDKTSTYEIDWGAVEAWLKALVKNDVQSALIDQLSPAEAERAKVALLGFFSSAEGEKPRSAPPTTSASEPASAQTRID